jgi:predicted GIY-YIG superfamily endonuclease
VVSDEQCFQDLKESAMKAETHNKSQLRPKKEKVTAKTAARVYAEATPP